MDLETYRELMDEFYETTGIDRPPAATVESWYWHVEKLELQTLAAVLEKMKVELGRRPYNMLFKLKEFIKIYYADNPDARPKPINEHCDDCKGEGVFFVKYDPNNSGTLTSAVVLCGSCENWRRRYGSTKGKLRLKKFEAEYQGFKIES